MFQKFSWGINIDNIWTYCGLAPPKSEIVPFVLSLKLGRGSSDSFEHPRTSDAIDEHKALADEIEPSVVVKNACDDLAKRLKDANISFVRTWFPWNFFKKKLDDSESIQFAMDIFVGALKANGIGILAVLANGYRRFLPEGASVDHLETYLQQLEPSWRDIVRHYKDSIDIWQIENEPNWWKGHVAVDWRSGLVWLEREAQDKILQTLYSLVRQECPNGQVVVNVEADRKPIDWSLYAKYADVLGLDFYPGYANPLKTTAEEIKPIAQEVKKQTGKQLIVAETGQPSGPRLLDYTEEKQAAYVKSACEEAYSSGVLDAICIWRFSDSYWKSFPMQENYFGLLTKELKPKQAWSEYVNQIKTKA
jgi:hypothetical protein